MRTTLSFITRPLDQFTEETIDEKLWPLANSGSSHLHHMLDERKAGRCDARYVTVVARDNKNKYIAWTLMVIDDTQVDLMFYVDKRWRRKGIGTEMMNRSFKYLKKQNIKCVYVAPWDIKSKRFFRTFSFSEIQRKGMRKIAEGEMFYWAKII